MSEFGLFLTVTSTRTVFCHLHLNFVWFVDYRNDKTECLVSTGVHVWIRRRFIKQIRRIYAFALAESPGIPLRNGYPYKVWEHNTRDIISHSDM